jgi:small-conductance mechanosensitive channel
METVLQTLEEIRQFLDVLLFQLGDTPVTLWGLLYLLAVVVLFVYLTRRLRSLVVHRLLSRSSMDIGVREATGTIVQYVMLVIGFAMILQTTGIDLTLFNLLAGSLGLGVGFGLQNIVNNFVSGLILLFERPIKVGDRIEIGSVHGRVVHLGIRSVTILTNDNISIIVPNQEFVTENIVNWSHIENRVRFRIPVTVAMGSDARLVERLLLEVGAEEPTVLKEPAPGVRLLRLTDRGLEFELRAWSEELIQRRGLLTSKLNVAIYEKFNAYGIAIARPQYDIFVEDRHRGA